MRPEYIELNRTFLDFDDKEDAEKAAFLSYTQESTGRIDWPRLLKSKYVVVLGEEGSGKTWELEAQAEKLRDKSKHTFFIRIEVLAAQPLSKAINAKDEDEFRSWLASSQEAVFFLDSVDEAKLRSPQAFHDALENFVRGIENRRERTRVIISSRVSEWRRKADQWELRNHFSISEEPEQKDNQVELEGLLDGSTDQPSENPAPALRIVQLAPLDKNQVEMFAKASGINDSEDFIAAIAAKDAWDFVGRPKDVQNYVAYWLEHSRLGSLTEMIKYDVTHKLRESESRKQHDPLSAIMARDGADNLAAAALFCRHFTFILPDDPNDPTLIATSIDPKAVLPEWKPKEVSAVLSRAIFDEATYGKVRFHHRSVAEYLAASWLKERVNQGCPLPELESLLFSEVHGREVVIPSRAPLVAWLAGGDEQWNQRILKKALRVKPEILLNHGDPEALSLDARRQLLANFVAQYKKRRYVRLEADVSQIRRLAHADLAPTINGYLQDPNISIGVRSTLLDLVRHGRITGCIDVALQIAADCKEDDSLRISAIAAIRDSGTTEHRRKLWTAIQKCGSISSRVCSHLLSYLYPSVIGVDELAKLIKMVRQFKPTSSLDIRYFTERLASESAPLGHLEKLLAVLLHMVQQPPYIALDDRKTQISERYYWLLSTLYEVIRRVLKENNVLTKSTASILIDAIEFLSHDDIRILTGQRDYYLHNDLRHGSYPLQDESLSHPEIRRDFVWRRIAIQLSDEKAQNWGLHSIFGAYSLIGPSLLDKDWLLEDIVLQKDQEARKAALKLATYLWNFSGRSGSLRAEIKKAVRGNKALLKVFQEQVPNWWKRRLIRIQYYFRHEFERECKKIKRKWRNKWVQIKNRFWFWRHLRGLRSGKKFNALYHLYVKGFQQESSSQDKYSIAPWDDIIPVYGKSIAKAARNGWIAIWRNYTPALPHEREERNRYDIRTALGLAGISAEIAEGLDITTLSKDEAIKATRFAICELNGFPDWFTSLCQSHPGQVRSVLAECFEVEWRIGASQEPVHGTLSKVRYADPHLQALMMPVVLELLQKGDPLHSNVLIDSMVIVLGTEEPAKEQIAFLAKRRIRLYTRKEPGHFFTWLKVWLMLNGPSSIDFIEEHIQLYPSEADSMMVALGSRLNNRFSHDIYAGIDKPDYQQASCLARMISLFYNHVRPQEDIQRTGSYSPEARDDAQEFRGALLGILLQSPDDGVFDILKSLLNDPRLASRKDWIYHLIDERAEMDAEDKPWQPSDVADFTRTHETDPQSADALFKIALKRLGEIKDLVENDDFSIRGDLNASDSEEKLQLWLANLLRNMARDRYETVREEEVDKKKMPDIRLHVPGLHPTTIEIKWAHDWSFSELEEALVDQLVGRYMKSNKSRHGILVLAKAVSTRTWKPEPSRSINFESVVAKLQSQANVIRESRDDIDALEVFSIDFTA